MMQGDAGLVVFVIGFLLCVNEHPFMGIMLILVAMGAIK